tara:strand:- start:8967 stop:9089 length:123 start_codon:yes stop_codon:yes gene_type:complete
MIQLIAYAGLTIVALIIFLIFWAQSFDIEFSDLEMDEDDV